MRSKNAALITKAERSHMERVKMLPCSVCDAPPPVEAHHINQGQHFTVCAVCMECHRGQGGWHGTKAMWRIFKLDELGALNITLSRLL